MKYTGVELELITKRLDEYEKELHNILLRFNQLEKRKTKVKRKKKIYEEDCKILLTFSGLSRVSNDVSDKTNLNKY